MPETITRRQVLQGGGSAAVLGAAACGSEPGPTTAAEAPEEVYRRLGIQPVINGIGTVTVLGGSIMPPEVTDAMVAASRHFVPLRELQQRAGDHLARLIGVPAAMICCGAASGITCGTAAAITSGDDEKLRMLPDTAGMKNEVIQQRAHRTGYQAQMRLVGAKDRLGGHPGGTRGGDQRTDGHDVLPELRRAAGPDRPRRVD